MSNQPVKPSWRLLLTDRTHGQPEITIGFPLTVSAYPHPYPVAGGYLVPFTRSFQPLTDRGQQQDVIDAFAPWVAAGAPRVILAQRPEDADIRVGISAEVKFDGFASWPGGKDRSDLWFAPGFIEFRWLYKDSPKVRTHEGGHCYGLTHAPAGTEPGLTIMLGSDLDGPPVLGPWDRKAIAHKYRRAKR